MKKLLCIIFGLFLFYSAMARHISGGEMTYIYLGPGTNPGTLKYQLTLKLYRECNAPSSAPQLDAYASFTVFNTATNVMVRNIEDIAGAPLQYIQKVPSDPCISDDLENSVCFQIKTYTTVVDNLPVNAYGYTVSYQRCCRIDGMTNISSHNVGSTYFATIPGSINGAQTNTGPVFVTNDDVLICSARPISFDFHATDADGDSLAYSFYNAFTGGGAGGGTSCYTCASPDPAAPPPYAAVDYIGGYDYTTPLGPLVTINPKTGLVSGTAPNLGAGANSIFAITVLVTEFRNGIKIGEHFKDLQIRVVDCRVTTALLNPRPALCDSFNVAFQNDASNNPDPAYLWDFGDPASGANNTSTLPTPMHLFSDTGVYIVKLVLDKAQQCSDSATQIIRVYPGFKPAIKVQGQCKNTDIKFTDLTTATYGSVNSWSWNFGDGASPQNTSVLQNPTHNYATSNTYPIHFIVGSTKGCSAFIDTSILITDKPALKVTNDTLICSIDTLQLNAIGDGSFLWSPNYNINNITIADPLVSPDITTTYHVQLTDPFGCVGTDSVKVRVVDFVTLNGPADTTICQTDPVLLRESSDGLHFTWTPNDGTISNTTILQPTVKPLTTTVYHLVATIGKCVAEDDVKVVPIPYPKANAGPDVPVCFGYSTQLHASGGVYYSWTPALFLSNTKIADPTVISPTSSVRYVVSVRDTLGCPKPVTDTAIVTVIRINASLGTTDTSVVLGQPLQLNATGGTTYTWLPDNRWLSSITIPNPVALPLDNITYNVRVSDANGCIGNASIIVRLYNLAAGLYVPNAFTPNGDGNNDVFKPIELGIKTLDLFRIYNRFGEMVYSTADMQQGWDGTYKGKAQDPGTYVWYADGTDYTGKKVFKKGSVVLIR